MPIIKIIDALAGALMSLAGLPPEAGPPERSDTMLARQNVTDLEQQVVARLSQRDRPPTRRPGKPGRASATG